MKKIDYDYLPTPNYHPQSAGFLHTFFPMPRNHLLVRNYALNLAAPGTKFIILPLLERGRW